MYFAEKNVTRFHNLKSTFFLNPKEKKEVSSYFKKKDYFIYYPYPDSEKCILYQGNIPEVLLYELFPKKEVRHQDILGSILGLNIAKEYIGDIILTEGRYFVYLLPMIRNYFESNFLMIGSTHVSFEEVPLSKLEHYQRSYEELEFIVSSNRIDTIVSHLAHTRRNQITSMMKRKEILLNYDYLKDSSYKLKEGDIFSIRRIGKFEYLGSHKKTKSGHLIVSLKMYTSH